MNLPIDIWIGVLASGLIALIILSIAVGFYEKRQKRARQSVGDQRIGALEALVAQKDAQLKNALSERQRIEEAFLKARDEADILKKDNSELVLRFKPLEKIKEQCAELKRELNSKTEMLNGLQGQYNELEAEWQKSKSEPSRKAGSDHPQLSPAQEPIPGFPPPQDAKVDLTRERVSDTEFLKNDSPIPGH